MINASTLAAVRLAAPSLTPAATPAIKAAQLLLPHLECGQRIDAGILRAAMESALGDSDAAGAWDWKTAYDACEAATVLFLRKFGPAMRAKAASPAASSGSQLHGHPLLRGTHEKDHAFPSRPGIDDAGQKPFTVSRPCRRERQSGPSPHLNAMRRPQVAWFLCGTPSLPSRR